LPKPKIKVLLIAMMFIMMMTSVYAILPRCDPPNIREACMFTSPSISCGSYQYDIINATGAVYISGNLTQLNQSIYYFNLTNISIAGDYLIRLCDNTTREMTITMAFTYIGTPAAELSAPFDLGTTQGIMILIVFLLIWVILIAVSLIARVPWLFWVTALFTLCLAIIIALKLSIVVGGFIAIIAIGIFIMGFYV
jgi:hypothetical protein